MILIILLYAQYAYTYILSMYIIFCLAADLLLHEQRPGISLGNLPSASVIFGCKENP